ncbi:MAPEG family protein [Roseibium salinum]|nr:MAPEG family protein [Roseibium salinum]
MINARRTARIGVGDGGNKLLLRRIRAQGNLAEYVPFTLLLMLTVEMMGGSAWLLYVLGTMLLIGRVSHAYGVSREPEPLQFRQAGILLTFAVIFVAALADVMLAISANLAG